MLMTLPVLQEQKSRNQCQSHGIKQQMTAGRMWPASQAAVNKVRTCFIYLPQLTRPHVRHVHKPLVVLQTSNTSAHIQLSLVHAYTTHKLVSKNRIQKFRPENMSLDSSSPAIFFQWPWWSLMKLNSPYMTASLLTTDWEYKILECGPMPTWWSPCRT